MMVQVALAALPMPSVRWPVGRPIVTPRYQRPVVFASSIRRWTSWTPTWRAVSKPSVETESGSERSLSIDLGTCTTLMAPFVGALDGGGAAHEVVAADGDERLDAELAERGDGVIKALGVARDVGAGGAEDAPAVEVDARDLVDGHLVLLVRVALREPLEAVVEADGRAAHLDRLDDDGADDAVRARRRAATDKDSESFNSHNDSVYRRGAAAECSPAFQGRESRTLTGLRRVSDA